MNMQLKQIRNRYLIIFIIIFSLVFIFSCSPPDPEDTEIGKIASFYAHDLTVDPITRYVISAKLLAKGIYCNVWAEEGSGVSSSAANNIANIYDNQIYNKMITALGENFRLPSGRNTNTMGVADYWGDNDGKLCILLLDIKDGFSGSGGYIAGYFWSEDLFSGNDSNLKDMIYIDTNPGFEDMDTVYKTLAHEMQHIMNFVYDIQFRSVGNYYYPMDIWINEGLSAAAEYIYSNDHGANDGYSKWSYFSKGLGLTAIGNNFYMWNNYPGYNFDDYATVYLFFQWLRLQAGGNAILKDISKSKYPDYDYNAVINAAKARISGYGSVKWETLLGDWHKANFLNKSTGIHGYKNDPVLKNVKAPYLPYFDSVSNSIGLAQGEAVYSYVGSAIQVPYNYSNVRYSGLDNDGNIINNGINVTSGALLAYNVNTSKIVNNEITNIFEDGKITDQYPPAGSIISTASFSSINSNRIYPVSMEEILRRNGFRDNDNNFYYPLPVMPEVINE